MRNTLLRKKIYVSRHHLGLILLLYSEGGKKADPSGRAGVGLRTLACWYKSCRSMDVSLL
jgi:hypothetical protein